MDSRTGGLVIVGAGVIAVGVGLLVASGALSWLGRLPGDVRIDTGRTRIFIPITSMILASLVLSALARVIRRLLG